MASAIGVFLKLLAEYLPLLITQRENNTLLLHSLPGKPLQHQDTFRDVFSIFKILQLNHHVVLFPQRLHQLLSPLM